MADPDYSGLFFGDDDTEGAARAAALAQALGRQRQLGMLGQLSGDKVLSGVGGQLLEGAQRQEAGLQAAGGQRLRAKMEADKAKAEAAWRAQQDAHQTTQDKQGWARLAQDNYDLRLATPYSPGYKINKKTGAVEMLEGGGPGVGSGLNANQEEKLWKEFTDSVSTSHGRSNLAMDLQKRLNASERVKTSLLNPDGTIRNLTPALASEAAINTASLLTNGTPGEHTIAMLLPKGKSMKIAEIEEWLLDEPQGANQQAYLKGLLDLANREEDTIGHQVRHAQMQGVPNYARKLTGLDKTRYESILRGAGLDPSGIDENGLVRVAKAVEAAQAGQGGESAGTGGSESPADRVARLRAKVEALRKGGAK